MACLCDENNTENIPILPIDRNFYMQKLMAPLWDQCLSRCYINASEFAWLGNVPRQRSISQPGTGFHEADDGEPECIKDKRPLCEGPNFNLH